MRKNVVLLLIVLSVFILSYAQSQKVKIKYGEFLFSVDYTMTVPEMVTGGNYDDHDISTDTLAKYFPFPVEKIGRKENLMGKLFIFHYVNYDIHGEAIEDVIEDITEDITEEMDKVGYRPATAVELFALGAQHPELQMRYTIVEIGSVWQDSLPVAYYVPGGHGEIYYEEHKAYYVVKLDGYEKYLTWGLCGCPRDVRSRRELKIVDFEDLIDYLLDEDQDDWPYHFLGIRK